MTNTQEGMFTAEERSATPTPEATTEAQETVAATPAPAPEAEAQETVAATPAPTPEATAETQETEILISATIKDSVTLLKELLSDKANLCSNQEYAMSVFTETLAVPGQLLGGSKEDAIGDFKEDLDYICR